MEATNCGEWKANDIPNSLVSPKIAVKSSDGIAMSLFSYTRYLAEFDIVGQVYNKWKLQYQGNRDSAVDKGNEESVILCKHLHSTSLSPADPLALDCLQVAAPVPLWASHPTTPSYSPPSGDRPIQFPFFPYLPRPHTLTNQSPCTFSQRRQPGPWVAR